MNAKNFLILACFFSSALAANVFSVKDFGAVADGKTDDAAAIYKAVAAAQSAKAPAVIEFASGRYCVMPPNPGFIGALDFTSVSNLTFRGKGTNTVILVGRPPYGGFRFFRSANIAVEELVIDYDIVPFVQGKVLGVDTTAGTLDLAVDRGYPSPLAPFFESAKASWGIKVGPGELYDLYVHRTTNFVPLGDSVFRFIYKDGAELRKQAIAKGDSFVHGFRWYVESALNIWESTNIRIKNVGVYASTSVTTTFANSENIHIDGFVVTRKPGSDRMISSCADGIHAFGVRGTFTIEHCRFDGMLDDSINIHCRAASIHSNISATKLIVNSYGTFRCAPGDRLQIYDPATAGIRGIRKVVSFTQTSGVLFELEIDSPLRGIREGKNVREADNLFNLDASGGTCVIRNNFFGRHRGRSVLLRTPNALVQSNTFENIDGLAVAMTIDSRWPEGPVPAGIVIEGNVFRGVDLPKLWGSPVIQATLTTGSGEPAKTRDLRDIEIRNNLFLEPRGSVIDMRNVDGLKIISNEVRVTRIGIHDASPGPFVGLYQSSRVLVDTFTVSDPNANAGSVLRIDKTVDAGSGGIVVRNLKTKLNTGKPDVEDLR
ncbi:MAG: hypothetical protein JNM63_19225 [Spirochaetia bacterium]|nr:hypothetical protein [Spirochaetia bacterium]